MSLFLSFICDMYVFVSCQKSASGGVYHENSCHLFKDRVFHWPEDSSIDLAWLVNPKDASVSTSIEMELWIYIYFYSIYSFFIAMIKTQAKNNLRRKGICFLLFFKKKL